jgi:hypothetical protein
MLNSGHLLREIASVFDVVKDRSTVEEVCIICPVPGCEDRTGNRHINLKTLVTHCWRCSDPQPHHLKSLLRVVGQEFEDNRILEPRELVFEAAGFWPALTPVQVVALPEGFRLLSKNRSSCYWRFCREMAERKHLSVEDLEEAGAGFTREGAWEPYCIFPVYEGVRCAYYQGRTYSDDGFDSTKRFPSKQVVRYGPSYWVYNLDALASKEVELVVIVESILNVLSLRRRLRELDFGPVIAPVCVFSHRLSAAQVAKLRRYKHIKEFCLLFDSDSTVLAEQTALNLGMAMRITVARMPSGINADGSPRYTNDANDDVDTALQAVAGRSAASPVLDWNIEG